MSRRNNRRGREPKQPKKKKNKYLEYLAEPIRPHFVKVPKHNHIMEIAEEVFGGKYWCAGETNKKDVSSHS